MSELFNIIKARRSVRTYDGRGLSSEDLTKLMLYSDEITNPFGIPVRFVFLGASRELSSPVLVGEKLYVAGAVSREPNMEAAFGYSFEQLVLHAWSLGIGTVWIGGTMNREAFEHACKLKENEIMPCITPIGYAADRMSVRESLMRKGVKADSRKRAEELFFEQNFETPLPLAAAAEAWLPDLFEMVRLAPSAVNKQPWRILHRDGAWHFFEKKDKGFVSDSVGDMQKIDVGIALCHFVLGLKEQGIDPQVTVGSSGAELPEDMEYVATVRF